jgi:hypothetical protein
MGRSSAQRLGPGLRLLILSRLAVDERTGVPPGRKELYLFAFDKNHKTVFSRRWEMDFKPHGGQTFHPYFACSLRPGELEYSGGPKDNECLE